MQSMRLADHFWVTTSASEAFPPGTPYLGIWGALEASAAEKYLADTFGFQAPAAGRTNCALSCE